LDFKELSCDLCATKSPTSMNRTGQGLASVLCFCPPIVVGDILPA
jgi:hypothetical protein